jgi:hypothetical protein
VSLADRFLVPPFSVLDARQGYWQARKRAWLALGIQSELGRGEHVANGAGLHKTLGAIPDNEAALTERRFGAAPGGSLRPATTLGKDGKTRRGDGKGRRLTWVTGDREDLDETSRKILAAGRHHSHALDQINSVYGRVVDAGATASQTGTSIFDPVLCEIAYRWFCPPGGRVLDPFAGGSVRGIVAAALGRQYTGIDLRPEQTAANKAQWSTIGPLLHQAEEAAPQWLAGDASHLAAACPETEAPYDFVFTCPPYADLERYSDDPYDLSTMRYPIFLTAYRQIIADVLMRLMADRFACIVVGDIRDSKGYYRNFVSDTIASFHDAGARLYNEAILVTMIGSLPLRAGIPFVESRKLGKTHQQVLVFCKGDPVRATAACGPVDVSEDELFRGEIEA